MDPPLPNIEVRSDESRLVMFFFPVEGNHFYVIPVNHYLSIVLCEAYKVGFDFVFPH